MPAEVRAFTVTVPAGTAQTAPVTIPLAVPSRTLRSVTVTIPAGTVGLVGFQVASGGVQIIPANNGAWIIGNDRVIHWTTDGYIDSGAFQCIAYNSDLFDHNLYFELELDPAPGAQPPANPPALTASDLAPAATPGA